MDWKTWLVVILVALTGSWMLFDGTRALIVGDYVSPKSGEYAGQLGSWSSLVKAIGIEARSTLMKSVFVVYGLLALAAAACFATGYAWASTLLFIVCVLGLWYLPVGTVANLIALILLLAGRR